MPFPEVVILSYHPPFYLSLLGLSFSARAQMLVTGLGLDDAYSIRYGSSSQ